MNTSYNPNIVRIFCRDECNNGLQFHFDFERDDPYIYITFLCSARYTTSVWENFKRKCKAIWAIIRGRDRCLHDLILEPNEWKEFYRQLTILNERMEGNK